MIKRFRKWRDKLTYVPEGQPRIIGCMYCKTVVCVVDTEVIKFAEKHGKNCIYYKEAA